MTCDQRRELLLLYVSDALDASQAAELRRHLQTGCPACAGYLAEAQALLAALPLGLDPIVPPPQLKARLMDRITASQNPPALPKRDDTAASDSVPMRLFKYIVPTAVAAGLAIVITHAEMNQRLNDVQQQANVLQHDNEAASMLIINQSQQLELLKATNQSQTSVVELLRSPDLKLVHLQPSPLQPNAVANLVWDKKRQQWALLTDGMTPATAGQTFELWFIPKTGVPVAAGTFNVDASGRGALRVNVPSDIGPLNLAAVTNETAGGVPQPKGKMQITGSVE